MGIAREVRKSKERAEEKGDRAARKMSRTSVKYWLKRRREGLWAMEVMGHSVLSSQACPCYLESLFPIYRGVRCGIQMAVYMFSEQLRDLKGQRLMSSLSCVNMAEKDGGSMIGHNLDDCEPRGR